jgi:glyoxylase-like metal-dependent hydrolase (beta-lactamase superfamily II)
VACSKDRLAAFRFTRVLPGHGRRFAAPDPDTMRAAILAAAR